MRYELAVCSTVADRRLDDGAALAVREVDRHLAVDRIAEEALVAGRQRGEPGVAEIKRAAPGIKLVKRQHPRREAGVAFVGQFDGRERVLPVALRLIEV